MYFIRKLRSPRMNIEHYIGLALGPVLIVAFLWGGVEGVFFVIAAVELLALIIQVNLWFRTKNSAYLAMAFAFLIITLFALFVALYGLQESKEHIAPLAGGVILSAIIILYIVFNKKIKWRTREMLELAAMPVSGTKNGFTGRPLPSGKVDGTRDEINAFALFLQKHLIAIPYEENGETIFSLTSTYSKQIGVIRGYEDESWISFGKDGKVSVFIPKGDYLLYKDAFTFDQLCTNLGDLFIEFFELFKQGDGIRIIDRLNALKLNPITE